MFKPIVLFLLLTSQMAHSISVYQIGNSLSWDLIQGNGLIDIFSDGGIELTIDYHIQCGQSLTVIAENPNPCVDPINGQWDEALSMYDYDLIVFQPHEGFTTQSEIDAIEFLSTFNSAPIAIYETYPGNDVLDIGLYYELSDQENFRQTRAEYQEIRAAFPDATVVPFMDVFVALESRAKSGDLPGVDSAIDFYRDARHFNHIGKYALGITYFTVLTGQDPVITGTDLHSVYNGVTDEQALIIQEVVADVILSTPTPTPLPTPVPDPTPTPSFIPIPLPTPTPQTSSTPLPTFTPTSLPTFTPTPAATPVADATPDIVPTNIPTNIPTNNESAGVSHWSIFTLLLMSLSLRNRQQGIKN